MSKEFILIVDDSKEMREFLAEVVFRPEGYHVEAAPCVEDALDIIKLQTPDLIITDFNMPGMSGLDMLDTLREQDLTVPIILITATGSEETAIRAFRSGIVDYFIKPFDPMALVECARKALAGKAKPGVEPATASKGIFDFARVIAIGKKITTLKDFDQILAHILEAAVYLTGAIEGSLTLVDQLDGLPERAVRFDPNTGHAPSQPISESEIIDTTHPILLKSERGNDSVRGMHTPLIFREEKLGILSVLADNLGEEQQRFISSLADYAALAIHNAYLFERADQDRKKLARLISNLKEPIILLDGSDRILLLNPVAYKLLGTSEERIRNQPRANTIIQDQAILAYLSKSAEMPLWEEEYNSADGRVYRMQITGIERIGRALIFQDITEMRAIEQLKDEYLAGFSHELRSSLTAILSYTDLMAGAGAMNDQQYQFKDQVKESVALIITYLNEINAASRTDTARLIDHQVILVQDLIRGAIMAIRSEADKKSIQLTYALPDEPIQILGDLPMLRQAMLHLLDNAVKFSKPDDEVIVSTSLDRLQVLIRVRDNGIGIPEADQVKLFKTYYRAAHENDQRIAPPTGLSAVQSIIESHEGRVWVESKPNQGSVFTILLPLYES